jgi:hypothetical protein
MLGFIQIAVRRGMVLVIVRLGSRGDAAVEYILLLALVALPAIPAFLAVASSMVREFEQMRGLLLLQVP